MIAAEIMLLAFAAGAIVGYVVGRMGTYIRGWRDGAKHMRALHIAVFGRTIDYRDGQGRLASVDPEARMPDLR
jgi:hypothetical protein